MNTLLHTCNDILTMNEFLKHDIREHLYSTTTAESLEKKRITQTSVSPIFGTVGHASGCLTLVITRHVTLLSSWTQLHFSIRFFLQDRFTNDLTNLGTDAWMHEITWSSNRGKQKTYDVALETTWTICGNNRLNVAE